MVGSRPVRDRLRQHLLLHPVHKKPSQSWEDLPEDIRGTWDKLGIPEAEKKDPLRGRVRGSESEVVYKIKKELDDIGVLFTDMDSALRDYPDLVKEHFGTLIPANDNKFAALDTAVWSGGSFIYVPPGVHVDIPLQAYFRDDARTTPPAGCCGARR